MGRHRGRTTYPPPLVTSSRTGRVTQAPRRARRPRLLTAKVIGGLAVALLLAALDAATSGAGLSSVWTAAASSDSSSSGGAGAVAVSDTSSPPAQAPVASAPVAPNPPAPNPPAPSPHAPPPPAAALEPAAEAAAGRAAQAPPNGGETSFAAGEPAPAPARPAGGPPPVADDAVAATGETVMVDGVRYRVQSPLQPWSVLVSPSTNYSRFELRAGDRWSRDRGNFSDGRQRAKLRGEARYPSRTDLWISYSLRWSGDIATTWGNVTELHADLETGETKGKPPPFSVSVAGGKLTLFTRADTRALTTSKATPVARFAMPLPPEGQWQNLVFRVRLDPYGSGHLTFWLNGRQQYDSGAIPIGYNDRTGPYFKYGLYRGISDLTTVMEFANVEVGTGSMLDRVSAPRRVPA